MIRPLAPADIDSFVQLRLQALKEYPEAFGASYEEGVDRDRLLMSWHAADESNFILGYFEADELVSILGFVRERRLKTQHKGIIWGMYVRPDQQGKGIGRKLMLAVMERAMAQKGLESILLSVTNSQKKALQLYESLGFQVYGTEPNALKLGENYLDEIFLYKKLHS